MPPSRLSPFQERILTVVAPARGDWVLTGGGALAGFHTRHRKTRDLDLFWRSSTQIQGARDDVLGLLERAGMTIDIVQSSPAFLRLRVSHEGEVVVVDLVADPVTSIEPPVRVNLGTTQLRLDSPHEILVNKLCALVQRSELRDLVDVEALLSSGCDLERALRDAPRKDAGFSPLSLVWLLREMPIGPLSRAAGETAAATAHHEAVRDELIRRIAALSVLGK